MCVAQFRDYCEAGKHKLSCDIRSNDKILPYDPYKGKQGDLYFCIDLKRMRKLAELGNKYAKDFVEDFIE